MSSFARLILAAFIVLGYGVLFALLHPLLGNTAAALAALPVFLIGWYFGLLGGLVAGLAALPFNILLVELVAPFDLPDLLDLPSVFVYLVVTPAIGGGAGYVSTVNRRVKEQAYELERRTLHDPLTGLPNRVLFMDRLEHALVRTARSRGNIGVLSVDLDRFKVVNDALGHEMGDKLLKAVAERLQACLRQGDTVSRLGGDEFSILLEEPVNVGEATRIAERILEALRAPFALTVSQRVVVRVSIGIALSTSFEDIPEELLRKASHAMYRAKQNGKARYELFEPSVYACFLERLQLESDLARAIEEGELRVYYQPKVLLETGSITAMEALVRWEHPQRGLLRPAEFIPLMEETGLIIPIGQWVLKEACRQVREWQQRCPDSSSLGLCVNLSAGQLQHPALLQDISLILQETGFNPSDLVLEITESTLAGDSNTVIDTLEKIKGLGLRIAIDDFGTGYSSLSYLRRFPIDALKIDRSFIEELVETARDTALISGIIDLAHALGMEVIAEGVETSEQRTLLRELDCEQAQGYYFSRPVPGEAAEALLEAGYLP